MEYRTPLNRHGITAEELPALPDVLAPVLCEGFALHLPMRRPHGYDPVKEITALVELLDSVGLPTNTLYVSHLQGDELRLLGKRFPRTKFRPRVGTRLWLGDRGALTAHATVLDVIPVERGERYGYRQQKARHSGHLLVVSGGTAHGIGLAAPKAATGPVSRREDPRGGRAGRHEPLPQPLHLGQAAVLVRRDPAHAGVAADAAEEDRAAAGRRDAQRRHPDDDDVLRRGHRILRAEGSAGIAGWSR